MRNILALVVAGLLAMLTPLTSLATTCSCAGVPILGAMQTATPGDKKWIVASTFEFHDLSDLVSGSRNIADQTGRDRTSQALILEVSRGLGNKWSVSALLSGVEHKRAVGGSSDTVSGLGDAILMLKYSPKTVSLYSKSELSFGLGLRLPVGENGAKADGVILAEDLQPSTGANGNIAWAYAAHALNESTSFRIYGLLTHTYNGDNDRNYQFGHATTASLGGSFQTETPWGFNIELMLRHAERDQRASVDIPNTGGNWLDVIPAVQYHLNESLALRASAKIPISRDLNDQLQFTTKFAVRISLSYLFGN